MDEKFSTISELSRYLRQRYLAMKFYADIKFYFKLFSFPPGTYYNPWIIKKYNNYRPHYYGPRYYDWDNLWED